MMARGVSGYVYAHLRRRPIFCGRGRRGVDDDGVRAAERARGVAAEPGVDALDMEAVAAARQLAGLLPGLELGEADRAVPARDGARALGYRDHGYRGEHRGVEPARRGRGVVAVLVGAGDGQSPERRPRPAAADVADLAVAEELVRGRHGGGGGRR
ncbi:hypothetical protein PVAP13_9KG434823 [Panicum virgatum]|uniref:Uncharacterized protein n=1 Tax=Panicum virgatum TaxID=38727 RepID=A0A8T0NRT2_PANVG|nr:hypothetical protein PVAP13_9KG434823 [Panicum virgatum]